MVTESGSALWALPLFSLVVGEVLVAERWIQACMPRPRALASWSFPRSPRRHDGGRPRVQPPAPFFIIMTVEAMPSDDLKAQNLTRRLVALAALEGDADGSGTLPAARAAERACRTLARSLGVAGFHALLTRALAQAKAEHPLLGGIRVGRLADTGLGDLKPLVKAHGADATSAGLEATMSMLFTLLGRLIGQDLVPRLVEVDAPRETEDDEEAQ